MIRVFPRRTTLTPNDRYAFVGDPPAWLWPLREAHRYIPVAVSCTFTWDIPEAERLKRSWSRLFDYVQVGGPAFGDSGGEFIPGRFVKKGAVITSRGCPRHCAFCLVPKREGSLRHLRITEGYNVLDNNLLACSETHIIQVANMLSKQRKAAIFSGGLDLRLLQPWHVELLKSIRVDQMFFACDSPAALRNLDRVANLMPSPEWSREKKRCYVLVGFGGESPSQAEERLKAVYNLDFLPFAMLYRGPDAAGRNTREFHDLVGIWRSPAAYKAKMAQERNPKGGTQLRIAIQCK